jgi:tetraacyldisaccharide 4'-kinase
MTRQWPAFWRNDGVVARALVPLATGFQWIAMHRRRRLQRGAAAISVPVVVVGNIAVGGTGKTPLVIWLARRAAALGWRPGVVLRGYGGRHGGVSAVGVDSDPVVVGDEALLIARQTRCPVRVGADRVAAARSLVSATAVDLVISDDGLQHYHLARDGEVVVVDAHRRHGNQRCLPAGPLREPLTRLNEVDRVIGKGGAVDATGHQFRLRTGELTPVAAGAGRPPVPGDRVHGIAGIGDPDGFFDTLRSMGFVVTAHRFGDHHRYAPRDLAGMDDAPVVMTEKDAVKCDALAPAGSWYLPVHAEPDPRTARSLDALLTRAKQRFDNRRAA